MPGAADTIAWLASEKIPYLFVTNTTSRPRADIVAKLAALGVPVTVEQIFTPPVAATTWLTERDVSRVALFVPEATTAEFAGFEIAQPEDTTTQAVVVGDLGEGWSFDVLNRAFRLLMTEPQPHLVALGMTRYWHGPDGLRLDTAPYVVALAHASGATPRVLGKPAVEFFMAALALLGAKEAGSIYMIGDDVRADVGGAQAAGLSGILVKTGKFRDADLGGDVKPDAVLESFAELPGWWQTGRAD